ncbi:MAG: hypothetical protein IJO98_04000 [Clostridia bacterium]|nr:hypothetical protein [Clostridia bacterium]MBQ9951283.1 hypothetical protein [Clostridia bacterium]
MDNQKIRRFACMLAAVLFLPVHGFAVTEGVVEAAPEVKIEIERLSSDQYWPDEELYAGPEYIPPWADVSAYTQLRIEMDSYAPLMRRPELTQGEIRRAEKLMEAYQSGERMGDGAAVLNKQEHVVVGVYPIDPADHGGECVYLVLPGTCLRDEEILSVIDAYAMLGLQFDPHALHARNCMRGGWMDTSRMYADEELERMKALRAGIQRGEAGEAVDGSVSLSLYPAYFGGKKSFEILPYRKLSDGELTALLLKQGERDFSGEIDLAALEMRARRALFAWLGCDQEVPLLHTQADFPYLPVSLDEKGLASYNGQERMGVQFTFGKENAVQQWSYTANVLFDAETEEILSMRKEYVWNDALTQENRSDPELTDDRSGLVFLQAGADRMTGCEGVSMMLAPGTDDAHIVGYGMTDNGWRIALTVERSSGNMVAHEYVRAENAVSWDELDSWQQAAVDAHEQAYGVKAQNIHLWKIRMEQERVVVEFSYQVFGETTETRQAMAEFDRETGELLATNYTEGTRETVLGR